MKKRVIIMLCYATLAVCILTCFLIIHPFTSPVEASTLTQSHNLRELELTTNNISVQISDLQTNFATYEKSLDDFEARLSAIESHTTDLESFLVDYYIDKLSDPTYTSVYNEDNIYYTAAESLGHIGKAAIPKLIQKLDTSDDYERALALYALLLASQADNVKEFAGNDYINVNLDFDARNHLEKVKIAHEWWEKYKANFE